MQQHFQAFNFVLEELSLLVKQGMAWHRSDWGSQINRLTCINNFERSTKGSQGCYSKLLYVIMHDEAIYFSFSLRTWELKVIDMLHGGDGKKWEILFFTDQGVSEVQSEGSICDTQRWRLGEFTYLLWLLLL